MIADNLLNAFSLTSKYFNLIFENNLEKFPQAIVFEGLDAYAQCFYALELARILNCTGTKDENCECLNCRWIRENKHPAINFVSQIHFKPSDDDSKTTISTKQAKEIEKSLRETSDYHRFFIFFDAKNAPQDELQKKSIQMYSPKGYNIFPDEDWVLNHINSKTFNPASINVLLKSVEEPPKRTTFVFLTKNRSDLLNTIVSRSQVFKLPSLCAKNDVSYIKNFIGNYPKISYASAFDLSLDVQNYLRENEIVSEVFLDDMFLYFINMLKLNLNEPLYSKISQDITYISDAKRQLLASINIKIVLEALYLKFARSSL